MNQRHRRNSISIRPYRLGAVIGPERTRRVPQRQPLRLGAAAMTVYRQHGVLEARVWPLVT